VRVASDRRVQAIRCLSCHRLRPHPRDDVPESFNCWCGGVRFVPSFPFPDEETWALSIYKPELEEGKPWEQS